MEILTGAVLSVLLILWVEIVERICHDVLRVDGLLFNTSTTITTFNKRMTDNDGTIERAIE